MYHENGAPPLDDPRGCNARTRKQYVQGGASLPEPSLFTCSDPPYNHEHRTNMCSTAGKDSVLFATSCKHRHCIAESHAADPRDTATAPDTVARGHAVLRAAKRHTTRPPHQGGLCAPWTQVHLHWLASQRGARAGREGPIRRTASLELRLVHPKPRDSRRSQCWSCSAGSLEAGPEQAKRAIKP